MELIPGVLHTYFLPRLVHCCVKIECILHAQTGRAGWPDAKTIEWCSGLFSKLSVILRNIRFPVAVSVRIDL
jgi:hypothetical protein